MYQIYRDEASIRLHCMEDKKSQVFGISLILFQAKSQQ